MRYWMDVEFIERGRDLPIRLISIGMVAEDGRTLYLVNGDVSLSDIYRHPWLQMNVWPHLPVQAAAGGILNWDTEHDDYPRIMDVDSIAEEILAFIGTDRAIELWTWYGSYDYVVFNQIFGGMTSYPAHLPMFAHEVTQEWVKLDPRPQLPDIPEGVRNAAVDALWVKYAWQVIEEHKIIDTSVAVDNVAAEQHTKEN